MAVNDPPIIHYPSAPVVSGPVELLREGEDLVVTIAPVSAARLILAHLLSMAALLVVLACMFPALMRFIRIQIAFADDRIESVLIPSPGGESLAFIEDNVRDAIGLPVISA